MTSTPRPPRETASAQALSAADRTTARTMLLAERERLLRTLAEQHGGVSRIEAAQAELARLREEDDAQSDETRGFDQFVLAREQEELRAIDEALARLDAGSYGLCLDCGEAISLPRLKAQPEATRCIACQGAFEADRHRRS